MGRRHTPLERKQALAKGDGVSPGGRKVAIPTARQQIERRSDAPPTPRAMGRRGKLEWKKIWAAGPWISSSQDYHWVEQICRAYDEIQVYRSTVERDGLVQTGSQGQPVAHPLISEIRRCEQTIRSCLSILGFSPTDRARLGLDELKRENALLDLMKKAKQ